MTDPFKICRYCSSKDQLQVSLFCQYAIDKNLPQKIEDCLQIKVSPNGGVSGYVCYECIYKIELFYDFKCKVKKEEHNERNSQPPSPRIEEKKDPIAKIKRPNMNGVSLFPANDKLNFIDDDSGSWFNMSDKFSLENEERKSVIQTIKNGRINSHGGHRSNFDSEEEEEEEEAEIRITNTVPKRKYKSCHMQKIDSELNRVTTRSTARKGRKPSPKKNDERKNHFSNFFQNDEVQPRRKRGRPRKNPGNTSQTQPLSRDLFESQGELGAYSYESDDEDDFDFMPTLDMIAKLHQ